MSILGLPIDYGDTPGKCIVCGAENGACTGDGSYDGHIVFEKVKKDPSATFVVPTRIYEDRQVGSRIQRRLLYAPGDRITPKRAKELGLLS